MLEMNYKSIKLCLLFLILTVCFLSLSNFAHASRLSEIDRDVFSYVHEDMKNKFLDEATPLIQSMGDPRFYVGLCAFLCAFGNEKMVETGKLASAGFIGTGGLTYLLKESIGRSRPLNNMEKDSFPSGHAAFSFTMATIVGHQYPKLRIPLYIGAIGTGFSRIYLGRHYPSDVIAGAMIGTLMGAIVIRFDEPILKLSF